MNVTRHFLLEWFYARRKTSMLKGGGGGARGRESRGKLRRVQAIFHKPYSPRAQIYYAGGERTGRRVSPSFDPSISISSHV